MVKRSHQRVAQPASGGVVAERPVPPHEIFTPKRLIIMFGTLLVLIIVLMYPTYRGRWHMNRAKESAAKGDYITAYKYYKWLGENTPAPSSATFHLELGNVCLALGYYAEAVSHFSVVVEKTSAQKGSLALLGFAYLKTGNIEEAKKQFKLEMERNPLDPLANFYLGELAFKEKRYSEATAYFSRVAFLPEYKEALKPYWATIEKEVLSK
ncbi:MAG: tetratricopeptide repeat protein [Candidatus Sumerlaeota bacterium]|nr:tetratricopeptide repeat protein [Candidatus Sumerlaeota bacterium]